MIGLLKNLFDLIGGFFGWWSGELAALIPPPLRRLSKSGGEGLLLEMTEGTPQLYRRRGAKPLGKGHDLQATLGRRKGKPAAVTLVLPQAEVVTRQAELPLAAEENLLEVVGFEMDRLTPFSREEVYYTSRITKRDAKNGRLGVAVMLAPRQKVDALMTDLRDQGLRVDAVDLATEQPGRPLGVNLLPQAMSAPSSRLGRVIAGALTATAAVLLFLAVQIPLERKADYAAALGERVTAERARVSELRRLEEEIAGLQTDDSSLLDHKQEATLSLEVVEQVTRLLPDDTWLNQLSLSGNRLELGGFSPNSSKLITVFERSSKFTEAVFRAPVTQDPRLGLERFSISMRATAEAAAQ